MILKLRLESSNRTCQDTFKRGKNFRVQGRNGHVTGPPNIYGSEATMSRKHVQPEVLAEGGIAFGKSEAKSDDE